MPSLQVVTWVKGWHATDMRTGMCGCCMYLHSIMLELSSGLDLLLRLDSDISLDFVQS